MNNAIPLASLQFARDGIGNAPSLRNSRIFNELLLLEEKLLHGEDKDRFAVYVPYSRKYRDYTAGLRVFLKGPVGSPYADRWWGIYVNIPKDYPYMAPIFRFTSVPYHPNITREGRVLFKGGDFSYHPSNHLWELVMKIDDLLLNPDFEDSILSELSKLSLDDPMFQDRAQASCMEAKDRFEEYSYFADADRSAC